MTQTEQARAVFAGDRYAALTGIAIDEVEEHGSRCSLKVDERHRNARGAVMGGVLFTMADFAAAVAANSDRLADGVLHWVSLDASIHYLSPAMGNELVVRSKAIKIGRSTALFQSVIECGGRNVAVAESTMIRVE